VSTVPRFVLASSSPARLKLLRQVGIEPEVVVSGVDESTVTGPPADVALTLAVRKATAVARGRSDALVLGFKTGCPVVGINDSGGAGCVAGAGC
jgi:septum formation protein